MAWTGISFKLQAVWRKITGLTKRFAESDIAALIWRRKIAFLVVLPAGAMLAALGVALGGHEAVKATETAGFCGLVCHEVHYPEYTTYQESPHSAVPCADCHIGAGLKNMVMAKVRGVKDIVPAITGDFDRPLTTPLKDLRPASETCEKCHWQEKFTGDMVRVKTTFGDDEGSSPSTDVRVLKVGGGKAEVASGIHWHSAADVWYLPVDEQRLKIAWVGVANGDGSLTEYVDQKLIAGVSPERIEAEKRRMDCVDCHNRVTHLFRSPGQLIDVAIADGSIDRGLPFIKRMGVEALDPPSATLDEAHGKVDALRRFYEDNYAEILENRPGAIDSAVAKLKEVARLTTFPERQVHWDTYINQMGHQRPDENMEIDWETVSAGDDSPGCFRCHGNLTRADASFTGPDGATTFFVDGLIGQASPDVVAPTRAPAARSLPGASLNASCKLCHYTLEGASKSPLAPGISHSIDGLDDCLVCHNVSGPRPFKTEHPWSNSNACTACHRSAPPVKEFPASTSEPAKEIAHPIRGMEDCLLCHNQTGPVPFKVEHPWSNNDTCTSCHQSAPAFKPLPASTSEPAKEIAHPIKGMEDCLLCHNQTGPVPFKVEHPWSNNDTCTSCHQSAPAFKPLPPPVSEPAKEIAHPIKGNEDCLLCHNQTGPVPFKVEHPWSNNDTCTSCHQSAPAFMPLPASTSEPAKEIAHPIKGNEDCLLCHNDTGPLPFKVEHPWSSNDTCTSCHRTAPAFKPLPPPVSEPAKEIAHPTKGNEDCLLCHNDTGPLPFKVEHPWSNDDTCTACHRSAPASKPLPTPIFEPAKEIVHPTKGNEDCLLCHNDTGPLPFKVEHPWSTTDTCQACHQLSSIPRPAPSPGPRPATDISHPVNGMGDCLLCHNSAGPRPMPAEHPWSTNSTCTACHTPAATLAWPPAASPLPLSPPISHGLGVGGCFSCHATGGIRPYPSSHVAYPETFCTLCHQAVAPPPANTAPLPVGPDIAHSTNGLPGCVSCHGQSADAPFPTNHVGRSDAMCRLCHQPAAGTVGGPTPIPPPASPRIPHTLDGRSDCVLCHGESGIRPFTSTHTGRTNATCSLCHQPAGASPGPTPGPSPTPGPTPGPSPTPVPAVPNIPHALGGYLDCVLCHSATSLWPFSSTHVGRTNDTCSLCHQPATGTLPPPPGTTGPLIGHAVDASHEDCLSCHGPGQERQFPASHAGRTNETCLICH